MHALLFGAAEGALLGYAHHLTVTVAADAARTGR